MENIKLISFKEAKEKGFRKYFTGEPCKKGHIAERRICDRYCVDCAKEYEIENKAKRDFHKTQWVIKNREKAYSNTKKWADNNKEKVRKKNITYSSANPEKIKAFRAKRRASELQRIPPWVDLYKIEEIYKERIKLEKETGMKYHTDHIIPLQGKYVSGLHVHTNLRNIPASENWSKNNKHESDSYWD